MSKIVKYCNSCEEGFASKFGFCPNCGLELQAFEMNPVNAAPSFVAPPVESPKQESAAPAETFWESLPVAEAESAPILEVPAFNAPEPPAPAFVQPKIEKSPEIRAETVKTETVAEPIDAPPTAKISEPVADEQKSFAETPAVFADSKPVEVTPEKVEKPKTIAAAAGATSSASAAANQRIDQKTSVPAVSYIPDSGFYVTVIEEKNVRQRNVLMLGSLMMVLTLIVGATVYSLFSSDLFVGAIGQGDFIASVPDLAPVPIDEVPPPPKKDNKDNGGGGGSGKEQDEDPAKGRLPPQVKNPITPPDPRIVQMTDPEIKLLQQTKGNNPRPITNETTGLPNGLSYNGSSGRGRGNGIGNGFGNGAGNGRGDGEGNGIGSGSGNGEGNSNGDGKGDGTGRTPPPPPVVAVAVGPTKNLNITSKPRPNYTDEARKNSVQGTVVLRVMFLASGQIGSVSPVSGLPNGLTEQAIAAAKQMRFEPAMKNGVAQSVTKQVQFSFTIY